MAREADLLAAVQRMNTLLALVAIKGTTDGEAIRVLSRAGYSNAEIGKLLDATPNAIKLRLLRSKRKKKGGKKPE
jgi:hypothetical protein